jgi:type I restriction enzyme S subunit
MEKYQSYKPSDVEWIGEIPYSWKETRLKYVGNLYGGLTGKSGEDFKQVDNPNNKPYIPYTNIFRNTYISKNHVDYVVLEDGENQNKVQKFDLFFLMSSETYQDLGKSCILVDDIDELYLNSFCKGFRVNRIDLNPLFLNYQLLGSIHKELISIEGRGFTRINLRQDRLNETPIFIPPLQEQYQIVQFLDEKTELIDRLISTKERKITLLKEQRISLVNQVITKGLNPNVKMKESGVDWIGDIPENWKVGKLKHICKENIKSLSNNTNPNYELDYIEISDVNSDGFIKNTTHYTFSESPSRCRRIVHKGDIILSTVRTYLRSIGLIENEVIDLICSTGFSVLTPNLGIYSKHLFYMVRTEWFISMIISKSEGVSYPSIQSNKLMNNLILVVPKDEQIEIVEYLDSKTEEIDELVQLEQKKIDLLKEYRQSLISEVVTGKIKVTN